MNVDIRPDQFRCGECGGVFDRSDDAEARAEAIAAGFDPDAGDTAIVCEDCYERIMGRVAAFRRALGSHT